MKPSGPVLFAYGFRPFFLLAGLAAFGLIGMWLFLYPSGDWPLGSQGSQSLPAQFWHGHEMLFGFAAAAIGGFLLTAVPSWTGAKGFAGRPLVLLALVWLLGRLAMAAAGQWPTWLVALLELAYLPLLAGLVALPLLRARNRNTPLLLVLLAFWASDAVFLWALQAGAPLLASRALQVALGILLLLITVIGGRIVPAFTGNALRQLDPGISMPSRPYLDRSVIALMAVLVLLDVVAFGSPTGIRLAGWLAALAAVLQAVRLAGWQGWRTTRMPIVWILHLAYAWLPVGLALKAVFLLTGAPWAAFWLHALGIGVAAGMVVAVMSRAALGHTGRPLQAAPVTVAAYVLLMLAALVRVFGPAFTGIAYATLIQLAGALWLAAFTAFLWMYAPILLAPRADGKPG